MKTENRLQQDCFIWLWNTYPYLRGLYFEIHNNAFSAQSGMLHKSIGRIAGVADNCLLRPFRGGPVFFEFKTESGRQTDAQKKWGHLVQNNGYPYYIVKSLQEFKEYVEYSLNN